MKSSPWLPNANSFYLNICPPTNVCFFQYIYVIISCLVLRTPSVSYLLQSYLHTNQQIATPFYNLITNSNNPISANCFASCKKHIALLLVKGEELKALDTEVKDCLHWERSNEIVGWGVKSLHCTANVSQHWLQAKSDHSCSMGI